MISENDYISYKAKYTNQIKELLAQTGARPVLFLGSGITKRYLDGPGWIELLQVVAGQADIDNERFNFLAQKSAGDMANLGSALIDPIHEWAWKKGKNVFPSHCFLPTADKSIFLKTLVSEHLRKLSDHHTAANLNSELTLLQRVAPHAVITTNFDNLAPQLFSDFERIVGEKIIPLSMMITGELFQIHGSIDDPSSIVLTRADYDRFRIKRKYISSKMMTYFAEYPIFIFGYGLGDSNVNEIIGDLAEALEDQDGLLSNVFYIEWVEDVLKERSLREEYAVPNPSGGSSLRVKTIVTDEFGWVLEALADFASPVRINTKILRHLAARVVDLVRTDLPKQEIEIDYKKVEALSESPKELALVLGISNVQNPNIEYPYCLTEVATKLGYTSWQKLQPLITEGNEKIGYDLKSGDNKYHLAVRNGLKGVTRRFSEEFVQLLQSIRDSASQRPPT